MQMEVHKTLYPFYTTKKIPYVTAKVTKIALRWQQCLFFSHASYHTVWKLHRLALSAIAVSLHYLPNMSAFNSQMRQNACYRNLKWTFEYLLSCYRYETKNSIRTIRSQVSQPASADKGADMSELQAHHCITPAQWTWLLWRPARSSLEQPKANKVKIFLPRSNFMKRPQTKFHADTMSDSKVIRSKKVKLLRKVKIFFSSNEFLRTLPERCKVSLGSMKICSLNLVEFSHASFSIKKRNKETTPRVNPPLVSKLHVQKLTLHPYVSHAIFPGFQ